MIESHPQTESTTEKRPLRRRRNLLVAAAILLLLFSLSLWAWRQYTALPEPKVYFHEDFAQGIEGWQTRDATWSKEQGAVRLASQNYAAPYLARSVPLEQAPPEAFAWHFQVRVSSFTDEAVVLGALVLPHSTVAVVVNGEGRLGVAHDLFAPPSYTTALLARLPKDEWQDIYLLLSDREKKLEVYLNNRRVITKEWLEPVFPVQQIWLGALWLKGAGNYGAPLDVSYKSTTLGNKGILPRPSFLGFLLDLVGSGWQQIKSALMKVAQGNT